MRLTAAEKYEVIRLVEGSDLSVRHTLRELQVPRATFYTWDRRDVEAGLDGLAPRPSAARRAWNRIPPRVRQRVVDAALAETGRQRPVEFRWHRLMVAFRGALQRDRRETTSRKYGGRERRYERRCGQPCVASCTTCARGSPAAPDGADLSRQPHPTGCGNDI